MDLSIQVRILAGQLARAPRTTERNTPSMCSRFTPGTFLLFGNTPGIKLRHFPGVHTGVQHFHTIAKIEAGATPNPTIETVKKIADALGISIDNLFK